METITFEGIEYPIRSVTIKETDTVVRVAPESLGERLFKPIGKYGITYVSDEAEAIDEKIACFVKDDLMSKLNDNELEKYVNKEFYD